MENKQKILYIVTKSNWGGAQRHVFDLATSIPKDKFEIVVAAGGDGPLIQKLKNADIRVVKIDNLKRDTNLVGDTFSFLSIFKLIRKEKPDILHLHSSKVGAIGALIGRILRVKKIVFTAHGWAFKEGRKNYQKIIIRLISWLTVFLSHKTIVVSKDDFEKTPKFALKNKAIMIHNGIAPFATKEKTDSQKEIFGNLPIYPQNLVVGTIAELHKNKGLSYAIKAIVSIKFQRADEEKPVLFGIIGDGEEKNNLQTAIEKNNLAKTIFLAGHKPDAQNLLSAFDLFILPSIKEGMPYALLEAGSAGLPVIASRVGGAEDVITDMETGILIRPADVKEISNALKFFIQNPEKIAEFGGKLKKRISEEFSLQKMVEKTIAVYLSA